ncbi:MAG: PqqD family protein [Xanthomonadales bacterium]|nr:PqqD family protein [Xanthomonadales bacterium]
MSKLGIMVNKQVKIAEGVISHQTTLGETLLLNTRTLVYFGLDEVGTTVWSCIQSGTSIREWAALVSERHALPEADSERKCGAILEGLKRCGLIEISSPGPLSPGA